MNYKKNYYDLIEHAKKQTRNRSIDYFELHHILPRSMGGDDNLENLVWLTAREHFIAHYLLWKFTTGENHYKMCYAFRFLSIKNNRHISSREYEKLKREYSIIRGVPIICLNNLQIFHSTAEAACWLFDNGFCNKNSKLKSVQKNIHSNLKKKRASCYGHFFEYYDNSKQYNQQEYISDYNNILQNGSKTKKIICLQNLKIYNSAREAEQETSINYKKISRSCICENSTEGYDFRFYDENKKYIQQEMKKFTFKKTKKLNVLKLAKFLIVF